MKKCIKVCIMIVSFLIAMTALGVCAASENTDAASYDLTLLQEGGFPELTFSAADYEAEQTEIRNALMNCKSQFDISVSDMDSYNIAKLYETVINNSPKLYNVVGQVSIEKLSDDEYRIYPVYKNEVEVMAYLNPMEKAVSDILAQVKPEMNNAEKILAVHDYILSHYEFDLTYTIYSANEFFINKRGVCQAYMLAFKYIMDELEIPCETVISKAMDHGWNIVQIGGIWYHVDVTWDDPTPDEYGTAYHNYLLLSDSAISNSSHNHHSWQASYKATSSKYDNYIWYNAESPMYYYGGEWYYAKSDMLYKFSVRTNTRTRVSTASPVEAIGIYDGNMLFLDNGIIYTAPMNNITNISKLDEFDYKQSGLSLDGVFFEDERLCYALTDRKYYDPDTYSDYYNYRYYYSIDLSGQGIEWTYKGGVLTISGKDGVIPDCENGAPWSNYSYDIRSVIIKEGVKKLGKDAFAEFPNLASVSLPNSLISIGDRAFYKCTALTDITIPDGVANIGVSAFRGCKGLKSITIGNGVQTIGANAFYSCQKLSSVSIPDSVKTIGNNAFYDCDRLTNLYMGNGVTTIGENAFHYCGSLTNVYITDLSAWCNISFRNVNDTPLWWSRTLYINNELTTDITIPEGTTSIGDYAFGWCQCLTSVTIPDSVTSIGDGAFLYCSKLTSVTIPDSITSIGGRAFYELRNLSNVYYTGPRDEWNKIAIGNLNSSLTSANIHYNTGLSNNLALKDGKIRASAVNAGTYKMIFAEYDKRRRLINIQPLDVTFDEAGVKYIDIPSDMNKDGVQVFLWDSLDKMKPLCSPIIITN